MNKNRKFDDFDQFACEYRNIHNNNIKLSGVESDYFSEHKINILKTIEKKDNIIFLDFGCGDGNSANHFANYFPKSNYHGIDVSSESIEIAKSRKIQNANFEMFDGFKIPFADNTFDIVFTACVFHHIDFKLHENLIQEIYRILKPGGKFYIFEHNPWNPVTRHLVNTCPFDEDAVLLTPIYTKKTLSKIFKKQKTQYILFFPRHKIFNLFIKLEKYLSKIPIGGQYFTIATK